MQAKDLICFKCKHFRMFEGGCDAFPDGIPDEITIGTNQHKKPLPNQKNNIVFEFEEDKDLVKQIP
jgi:hypothetical protein